MFRMMTPVDAFGLSLRAGMMFGQAQTLWATRMMEMQGFWIGFPRIAEEDAPLPVAADPEDGEEVALPPLTEIHVEALAAMAAQTEAEPVVEAVAVEAPVAVLAEVEPEAEAVAETVPVAEPEPAPLALEPEVEPAVPVELAPPVEMAAEPLPHPAPGKPKQKQKPNKKPADSAE